MTGWPDLEAEFEAATGWQPDSPFIGDIPVGLLKIELVGDNWVPREDGVRALIIGAVQSGELVDLVAILPKRRGIATRTGNAAILGWAAVEMAAHDGRPLTVEMSAVRWLLDPYNSVFIVDWRFCRPVLDPAPILVCPDEVIARRLHLVFDKPPTMPRIDVQKENQRMPTNQHRGR